MTARLDPRVADLVRDAGQRVREHEGGFTISTSDVRKVVTDVEGTLSVEAIERGVSNGFDLLTQSDDVLQRYVVTWVLNGWRSEQGLGFLPTAGTRQAPGYVVVDDGDAVTPDNQIRRLSDGVIVARRMADVDAEALVVALPHSLDDVLAAARDRDGAPVWAKARRWLRR